jgi:hypothetical protein
MAPLQPVWQGVILGLPVALLALFIYRLVSNQAEITQTKNGIKAQLLALRLFRDDLRVVLRAEGRIFRLIGRYLRLALLPMAILLIPVVLLIVQAEARFAYAPLELNQPALVTVELTDAQRPSGVEAELRVPAGLRLETPALRLDAEQRLMWRISALQAGEHEVTIVVGDVEVRRQLWFGDSRPRLLVPAIYRPNDIRTLANPAERPVEPASAIATVTISYPDNGALLAGLSHASWWMILSSLIFGFLLRRPLRVDF